MAVTAKEIAAKLGLSETAISMALNNRPGVSTETKALILKTAEEMGYDFSRLSRRQNAYGSIFCVVYRAHNAILNYLPIFSELTDGIAGHCQSEGYFLKTVQVHEKLDNVQKCIEDIRISNCRGVILLGTEMNIDICRQFLELSVPVILLDSYFDELDCSSVLINNVQGAYLASSYLIDKSGRQPGHLRSSYKIMNFVQRRAGFERAVREHGMSVRKCIDHELSPSIEGAFADMLEIIDRGDELADCYFADNDLIAIGAIKAFKSRGYRVPEDISVIGFDNISESRIIDPALTTVDIPRKYMGQLAARQLIAQIKAPSAQKIKIEVSAALIKRGSVLRGPH